MSNNWNDILYTVGSECGVVSKLFFVFSFVVLVFVMLNIFTAIVLESFVAEGLQSISQGSGVIYIRMTNPFCIYKLQRRHRKYGFELHMDLMDNERAELLRVTEEGNMFQKV